MRAQRQERARLQLRAVTQGLTHSAPHSLGVNLGLLMLGLLFDGRLVAKCILMTNLASTLWRAATEASIIRCQRRGI